MVARRRTVIIIIMDRIKPFAAYDLDGTLFKSSVLEKATNIAVELSVFNGAAFDDANSTKEKWQIDNNEGTYNAYVKKLVDAFVGQMKGVRVDAFDEVVAELIRSQSVRRYKFTKELIRSLNTHTPILITGSPLILAQPFVEDLSEIKHVFGSTYEQKDGHYTGIAHSVGSKAVILQNLINTGAISQNGSIAVGDTMSDNPMLHMATHPIMFNPSHTLANYGQEFGWDKVFETKDNITPLVAGAGTYAEVKLGTYLNSLRDN